MHAHSDTHPHTQTQHPLGYPHTHRHTPQADLKIYVVIKHEQGINFRCQRHSLLLSRFDYNQSPVTITVTVTSYTAQSLPHSLSLSLACCALANLRV